MQRLEQDLEIFKSILDALPNSIYLKDLQGRYVWLNKASITQLEQKHAVSGPITGKTDFDVFLQEDASEAARDDQKVIESKQGVCTEEDVLAPSGEKLTQLFFKEPLYDGDSVVGVLGYTIDITEMRKKEEALREKNRVEAANKVKTEFLENIRHNMRTPITGIIGFAQLIKDEVSDPRIKEYVDNLIASSHALVDFLNAVSEVIKINSGEIPLLKKKFNLREKLNSIILLNQEKANQKNLHLQFEYDPEIPTYLIGDSVRLHRIISELVANSLNFTRKGHVQLSVKLARDTEKNAIIKIVVEDTGIGIEREEQQEIYLQFKRISPSYDGVYKGFGLGLSIVKQFVGDLEGELYVESEVGVGSKFTVIVGLKKPLLDDSIGSEDLVSTHDEEITLSAERASGSIMGSFRQSRILVVEDSAMAGCVITNMLVGMNCQVDLADSGRLAVRMADENQYDLIFMDIGLPDIDGYEVTKQIRLSELYKAHVPIIALTAHADEDDKKHCIGVGMNAVLTKPLAKGKAEDILNSFISHRRNTLKPLTVDAMPSPLSQVALPVFDFEWVRNQFGSEKVALDMMAVFLSDLPHEVEQLQTAHDRKDWPALQALAHRLKGGVSYCGASRLNKACLELEVAVKDEQRELWDGLYDRLLREIFLLEEEIKPKLAAIGRTESI